MLSGLLTLALQDESKSTAFAWISSGINSNEGKKKISEKGLATEWTSGFVAGCKPFVLKKKSLSVKNFLHCHFTYMSKVTIFNIKFTLLIIQNGN